MRTKPTGVDPPPVRCRRVARFRHMRRVPIHFCRFRARASGKALTFDDVLLVRQRNSQVLPMTRPSRDENFRNIQLNRRSCPLPWTP